MKTTLDKKPQKSANKAKNKEFIENQWEKGQSGNPKGRPIGAKSYSTLYREAIIKLAKLNDKEPEELELEIIQSGIANARKGDYRFFKDMLDRLHGMPKQSIDMKTDLTISDVIDQLNDNSEGTKGQELENKPPIQDQK